MLLRPPPRGPGGLTAVCCGVIFEWEGVIVEDDTHLEKHAWLTLAEEEGKSPPPAFMLKRVEGMKSEHAIAEVLCWSRDPSELRRLAARKEKIIPDAGRVEGVHEHAGQQQDPARRGLHAAPQGHRGVHRGRRRQRLLRRRGGRRAEDVYRGKPDPELFLYAAQLLRFIPERCIVFGNSNSAVEAAHDARMKCVAVASKHPVYELGAADLVVKQLDELSVVDLKNLAAVDDSAEFGAEPEVEEEEEEEDLKNCSS